MHRDIKPHNILIDKKSLTVKISDWGLAEYYLPDTEYNVRVASRHFKGPELLLNNRNYDFSLDIWSLGLVFAGFVNFILFSCSEHTPYFRAMTTQIN
jgi:casein kinase II subunit alpha